MVQKTRCCGCNRTKPIKARCLCSTCYQTARAAVVRGEITWRELEERGIATAANQNPMQKAIDEIKADKETTQ